MAGFTTCLVILASFICLNRAQVITVPSTTVNVAETAGMLTITATHSSPSGFWGFAVTTTDGTASAPADYTSLTTVPRSAIAPVDTIDINIPIIDDMVFDPAETFTVTLTGLPAPQSDIVITVTIDDNEIAPVNLTQPANMTVSERAGNYCIPISRDDLSTHAFNYTLNTLHMTAIGDQDYVNISSALLTFPENEASAMICVVIIDDVLIENTEVFCVVLSGPALEYEIRFYILITDDDTPVPHHCRRGSSQPCLNGGTCVDADGSCMCPADFEGANCGIEKANITTGCGCVNGTCMNNGVSDVCVCQPGYADTLCDKKAYYHECTANAFSVCITPFSIATFKDSGSIYVVNKKNVSECNLNLITASDPDDGIVDWCRGYGIFVKFNWTCGELGPMEGGGVTYFVLVLRVQFTSVLKVTDQILRLSCQFNNESLLVSNQVNAIDPSSSVTNVQRETRDFVPAQLEVMDNLGSTVVDPVSLGELLVFCVTVKNATLFNGVRVDGIIIHNNQTGSAYRFLEVYRDGCIPANESGTLRPDTGPYYNPDTDRHTMCFKIEVFIFEDDNSPNPAIGVIVQFTIYRNASEAEAHVCGARKKRQALPGDTEHGELEKTVYLINPRAGEAGPQSAPLSSCSKDWLVPALIGVGIVAITLAVIVILLAIAVFRRFREKKIPYS